MTAADPTLTALRTFVLAIVDERLQQPVVRYLTVAEYAAQWSLSTSTVRAAIREGRLPIERVGKAIRIAADARVSRVRRGEKLTPEERGAALDLKLLRGGK